MNIVAFLLLTAVSAQAREHPFTKRVDPGTLQKELNAAGFSVDYVECIGDKCRLHMPGSEKKNPAAVIAAHQFVDPFKTAADRRDEAKALAQKLKAGAASAAEKDRLLLLLTNMLLGD